MTHTLSMGVTEPSFFRFFLFFRLGVGMKVLAGYIIGTRGQTINKLMRESKAKIFLNTYQDRSGHDVVITGPAAAVQVGRFFCFFFSSV